MQKIKNVLMWLDEHILEVLAYLLIVFIPLMPKLPLFEAIPGYIVRVRSEDILIACTGIIWLIQFFRGKIVWKTPLTWVIAAYAGIGILSTISAVLITKTVPAEMLHIGKTLLHYFRYLEYFFMFFLVVAVLKTRKQLQTFYFLFIATLIAIAIYGYGQRHYYWPVYSTMNREFSKGVRLVLTPDARVQSTFGGHYDLAAYLVIVLPIILASLFVIRSRVTRASLTVVFIVGMWLMVQTSSRSSFLGFAVASYVVIWIFSLYRDTWIKRVGNFVLHSSLYTVLLGLMIFTLGQNMYERFLQTIRPFPVLNDNYHYLNHRRKIFTQDVTAYVYANIVSKEEVTALQDQLTPDPPANSVAVNPAVLTDPVLVASDTQPVPAVPSDVTTIVPEIIQVATKSADGTDIIVEVEVPRTYSDEAFKSGLSAAIRYDTLWPRAIAGFMKNPVVGSGYATLTKESVGHFTEAESTDNNFLRTLGETGLLGFITFYGAIIVAVRLAYQVMRRSQHDELARIFAVSFIAATIGLLINALYIDVFAASKVAFTFWTFTGIITALYLYKPESTSTETGTFAQHIAGLDTQSTSVRKKYQLDSSEKKQLATKHKKKLAR
jgi:hypothetical protein